ncbi:hypothetical protein WR25_11010 [Diploscapter pachys]|uniref:SH2 domain-containing protein n=1 Tax=Diploscapter pachys TaxID=2018661 RepID=A0A2A2K2R2_9BILA|nr:hypothetical protein WR25_11010 [Diploscapter pachys]
MSVVMSEMDMESSSAFSPSEPDIDSAFVSKHNQSAEIYQSFKDDVDALLAGKIAAHDQPAFIQRILHKSESLLIAFEDEKQHLMSDVLLAWAIKQQRASIGTLWTQQLHYKQLDTIHLQFEYFGELLQQTLSGLNYLKQYFPNSGFDEMHSKLVSLVHYFLVLGGSAFGLDNLGEGVQVQCYLITDETAKQLLNNAYLEIFESEEFAIEPPTGTFQKKDTRGLRAKFDDMAIVETPQKNSDGPSIVQPRMFTMNAKQHLINRLKPNQQGFIQLDNFMKMPVAEEYQLKKSSTTDGEWKLVPFYEWFLKLAEVVNKYLYSMWYDGLIFGFCSKEDAENLLRSIPRSVLLVRFSDIEYAKIKISVKDRNGEIRHHWYEHTDLNARSLSSELLANQRFAQIDLIYPDIDLEVALGGREKPRIRVPRNLEDEIYFDNQAAATSF